MAVSSTAELERSAEWRAETDALVEHDDTGNSEPLFGQKKPVLHFGDDGSIDCKFETVPENLPSNKQVQYDYKNKEVKLEAMDETKQRRDGNSLAPPQPKAVIKKEDDLREPSELASTPNKAKSPSPSSSCLFWPSKADNIERHTLSPRAQRALKHNYLDPNRDNSVEHNEGQVHREILKELKLGEESRRSGSDLKGYVYALRDEELGLVKIGYSRDVLSRRREIKNACNPGSDLTIICGTDESEAILTFRRLERLVHCDLQPHRWFFNCVCRNNPWHQEWYDISDEIAKKTLTLWRNFLIQNPYDVKPVPGTYSLSKEWRQRLEHRKKPNETEEHDDHEVRLQRWETLLAPSAIEAEPSQIPDLQLPPSAAPQQSGDSIQNTHLAIPSPLPWNTSRPRAKSLDGSSTASSLSPSTSPVATDDAVPVSSSQPSGGELFESKSHQDLKISSNVAPFLAHEQSPTNAESDAEDSPFEAPDHLQATPTPALRSRGADRRRKEITGGIATKGAGNGGHHSTNDHNLLESQDSVDRGSSLPPSPPSPIEEQPTSAARSDIRRHKLQKRLLYVTTAEEAGLREILPSSIVNDMIEFRWPLAYALTFLFYSVYVPTALSFVTWLVFLPIFVGELRMWFPVQKH